MTHHSTLSLIDLNRRARHFLGRAACMLALASFATASSAAGDWLTVVGDVADPIDPSKDVVQVNPGSISDINGLRSMQIRAHRSENRVSWDGVAYRSFDAMVEFDCEKKTARYLVLNYFMEPVWRGKSHQTSTYTKDQFRPMAFRSMSPNPAARIIRAACESKSVISN